jgi:hypothetical protein
VETWGEGAGEGEALRRALQHYTSNTVPALDIDSYAKEVYEANRAVWNLDELSKLWTSGEDDDPLAPSG